MINQLTDEKLVKAAPQERAEDDLAVIEAILQGSVERFAELVSRHQAKALRIAFSIMGNSEDAKDAIQEAFVSVYQALGRFQGKSKFSSWLHRIVVNKCHDLFRRRSSRVTEMPVEDTNIFEKGTAHNDPSLLLEGKEMGVHVTLALKLLSIKQRTAFSLHNLHDYTVPEVAEMMDCSPGTVKSHLFRATEKIRAHLEPLLKLREI